MTTPIPAATLIVMRDSAAGAPELLMVERAQGMAFAGGALVFPGGRVDPADHVLASTLDLDPDQGAAQVAAIRETVEEAGVAIGWPEPVSADVMAELRARLQGGEPLAALLPGPLDVRTLTHFARWLPLGHPRRVFDTHFYLAKLPDDTPPALADAGESVRVLWASAAAILAMAEAGDVDLIFPTRRNLERLAQFASFEAAVAHARNYPVRAITPEIELRGGMEHLCIPDGLGYPVTSEPLDRVGRG